MWDFRELKWMNYMGWWPPSAKTERGVLLSRYYGYFLYFLVVYEFVPEFFGIIQALSSEKFDVAIFNITQTSVGLQWLIGLTTFLPKQKDIAWVINKLKDMDRKTRSVIGDEAADKLYKPRERICHLLDYNAKFEEMFVVLWNARPLFVFLFFGDKVNLIDAWTPVDTTELWGWIFMYIIQGIHVAAAVLGIVYYDALLLCLLQMYHLMYDYLKYLLRGLKFPYRSTGPLGVNTDFRYAIQLHQDIVKIGDIINDVTKHMLLYTAINTTVLICVSVFEFTKMTESSIIRPLMIVAMVCFEIGVLLLYCWFNQSIQDENEEVTRAGYDNNWYEGSVADRKDLFFLIEVAKKRRPFGIILESNLELFIAIMKSAFSYYQFLDTLTV